MKNRLPILLAAAVLATGCNGSSDGPPTADRGEELRLVQVGEALRSYQINKGKAPKSLKELRTSPGDSGGADLIANGSIEVAWGAALPDTKEEGGGSPNEEILAYGKEVPIEGGPVLLLNRTVRRMTADEFRAASRAKP